VFSKGETGQMLLNCLLRNQVLWRRVTRCTYKWEPKEKELRLLVLRCTQQ